MRAVFRIPGLERIMARGIGLGVRPEHIHTQLDKTAVRDTR
jgi:hypothetical protein